MVLHLMGKGKHFAVLYVFLPSLIKNIVFNNLICNLQKGVKCDTRRDLLKHGKCGIC